MLTAITTLAEISFVGNKIEYTVETSDSNHLFYRIGLILYDGDGVEVARMLKPVDNNDRATFSLACLKTLCTPNFTEEFTDTDDYVTALTQVTSFKLKYFERYGTPAVDYNLSSFVTFKAVDGGVGLDVFEKLAGANLSVYDWIDAQGIFMTFHPDSKRISLAMPDSMVWICSRNGTYYYRVKVTLSDGTFAKYTIKSFTGVAYTAYELCCQPSVLPSYVRSTNAVRFAIWIEDRYGERVSEVRQFEIDRQVYVNERYFKFKNSLGFFDTLRTVGQQEATSNMARLSYTDEDSHVHNTRADLHRLKQTSIGYVDEEIYDYLDEIYMSDAVYEQIDGEWKLVTIETNEE